MGPFGFVVPNLRRCLELFYLTFGCETEDYCRTIDDYKIASLLQPGTRSINKNDGFCPLWFLKRVTTFPSKEDAGHGGVGDRWEGVGMELK